MMDANRRRSLRGAFCGFALACAIASMATGAWASVPGEVNYQGLLLDDQGSPIDGSVALVFALFDDLAAGTQLWSESHPSVAVSQGIYEVALGSLVPIDASLLAGGEVYLEISVDGDTLSPRQRLLAVPYAVRAAVAESVEAEGTIDGVPATYLSQMFLHTNFDGGPPNDDPLEGFIDSDGDSIANFIDPDNDDDGISDTDEIASGSHINLVTPRITSRSPSSGSAFTTTTVSIVGVFFDPAMSVAFGTENPVPYDVTSTSLKVDVGPQSAGVAAITLTHPNSETATSSFNFVCPTLTGTRSSKVFVGVPTSVEVTGTNLAAGLSASLGPYPLTPTNLTPGSFDVVVDVPALGTYALTIDYPNGCSAVLANAVQVVPIVHRVFVTSTTHTGALGGLAGADAICQNLARDADLPGTFIAWLSDSSESPSIRSTQIGMPYLKGTSTVVANDWSDLTDGVLASPINVTEKGGGVAGDYVWTNTAANGTAVGGHHCADWTDGTSGSSGRFGTLSSTTSDWTSLGNGTCDTLRRLYCIGQ